MSYKNRNITSEAVSYSRETVSLALNYVIDNAHIQCTYLLLCLLIKSLSSIKRFWKQNKIINDTESNCSVIDGRNVILSLIGWNFEFHFEEMWVVTKARGAA